MSAIGREQSLAARNIETPCFLSAALCSTIKRYVQQRPYHAYAKSDQSLFALGRPGERAIEDEQPSRVDARRRYQLERDG